jgi:PAS domain S-box-containing protein
MNKIKKETIADVTTDLVNEIELNKHELISKILHAINVSKNFEKLISDIVNLIKDHTRIQAIAIRLKKGNDYPYYCSIGFPKYFVKRENSLLLYKESDLFEVDSICADFSLNCMCGAILQNKMSRSEDFITDRGSFWTNSSTLLLQKFTTEERSKFRNECNRSGYESVALIPIKLDEENLGLLQLNDKRRNIFSEEIINYFEDLCESIGLAIQIKNREEELISKTKLLDYENKLLNSLYKINQLLNRFDLSDDEIYENIFIILNKVSAFPQFTNIYFEIETKVFKTENYTLTANCIKKKIFINGINVGKIIFSFSDESPEFSDDLLKSEFSNFIEMIAANLEYYLQQYRSEKLHILAEMRFNTIWQNSYDAMRLTDSDGNIVAVNDPFCKLVDMQLHELMGKNFACIYDEEKDCINFIDGKIHNQILKDFSMKRIPIEKEVVLKSKKKVFLEITYSLIKWEENDYLILAIFRDNTAKVKAEQNLVNLEKLAAIGKLTSFLTHEIKSYINPMKMTISYLNKNTEVNNGGFSYTNLLKQQIERLEHLVKDTLEYSKYGSINLKSINLYSMVESLKSSFTNLLEAKEIKLTNYIDNEINLMADFEKIQCVFLHLIENSIEASNKDGSIEISAKIDLSKNITSIIIKDNGNGIKDPKNIFEPFITTKSCGTGLGLPLVKKYLELHKADINLVSSEPGNTIFEIIFPLNGVNYGYNSYN